MAFRISQSVPGSLSSLCLPGISFRSPLNPQSLGFLGEIGARRVTVKMQSNMTHSRYSAQISGGKETAQCPSLPRLGLYCPPKEACWLLWFEAESPGKDNREKERNVQFHLTYVPLPDSFPIAFIFENFDLKLTTIHTPKVQADVVQYFWAYFATLLDNFLVIIIALKCFSCHPLLLFVILSPGLPDQF